MKTFTSLEAMLSKAALDMCVVILPHNLHAETCVACLEAGKHVVCEKPMAITTEECTRMIEAARKAKRTLSIYQSRRYDAHYYMLKELLASGVIGQVFHLESFVGGYAHPGFTWRSDKAISGGALHDWGAHLVDWSFGLVGEKATSVTGFFHKRFWLGVTNDDKATGVIRFESGAEARVTVSNLEAGPRPFWVIQGTSGTIVMPDWETIKVYHATTVGKAETTLKVTPHSWFTDWSTYYFDLADHLFLGDRDPCSGEEGRRNIAIIEAAERSSKSGQSVAPAYHY